MDGFSRGADGDLVPGRGHRLRRAAPVVIGVGAGVAIMAVVIWVRFASGVSAAPVPLSVGVAPLAAEAAASTGPSAPTPAPSKTASGTVSAADVSAATAVNPELASPGAVEPTVDGPWLDRVAAATGISRRALQAYAGAELELEREKPGCHLGWNTLAGIGTIESNNGRVLTSAGYSASPILGPALPGGIRAEGPMQFLPSTWARSGADGNGDGVADVNQIDDAALAAARYLCSYGDLSSVQGWHAAVFGYNHLESYVTDVAARADDYARRAS